MIGHEYTAGPWLMRFSVVRFSLVRSLKKIQKNLAYADFHQSPSLVRKISMIQIRISISQITISKKKRGISLKKTNLKSETKCKKKSNSKESCAMCKVWFELDSLRIQYLYKDSKGKVNINYQVTHQIDS